ncbi:hypothetical protein BABINDRAFT_163904 [Babjeviella inositovora NRRL Y-12698]|uniref:Uncharacterized protein n=1 Tax=Babjeviella inositovora NRRL Y-12698 TaxID=984486 RepID=A0A1E3QH36_9ASCO|nr:uncharacterized protein BABINDRAFT_163904 [Babjeviella inositovora NRRL Y-12698]ODQ77009.1 hypothetical protein BABINDRAFT_163904 [Babjeviella inositovora NRRL Y-12698]
MYQISQPANVLEEPQWLGIIAQIFKAANDATMPAGRLLLGVNPTLTLWIQGQSVAFP